MTPKLFGIKIWVLAWQNGQLLPTFSENLKVLRLVVLEQQRFTICHFDLKTVYISINKTDIRNNFKLFLGETFGKIFKKSFILDQSQVCISNGFRARALQREALICVNAFFHKDC